MPSPLGRAQNPSDGRGQAPPLIGLRRQLPPAFLAECVKPRAAVVVRASPLGVDPSAVLETLQGGIERSVIDEQRVVRLLPDGAGDALSVLRAEDERAQD